MFSKPKTRHIIPDYVIPSEKKRDEIRFNIRMKMFLASGIEFPSAVEAQAQKKVPNKNAKVANKVTNQDAAALSKHVVVNADVL